MTNNNFFFKAGSHSNTTILGRTNADAKILTKNGQSYTSIQLVTAQSYTTKDGVEKVMSQTVPVFVLGELAIKAGDVVLVNGEIETSVVVPKSETNKYEVTQLVIRASSIETIASGVPEGFRGLNVAEVIGRVGNVRQIKTATLSGAIVTVAVKKSAKTENGQWSDLTHWIECSAWGKRSESVISKLAKGDLVLVKGKLNATPRKIGEAQRLLMGFNLEDFNILNKKAPAQSAAPAPAAAAGDADAECPFF